LNKIPLWGKLLLDILRKRRSIRRYEEREIAPEIISGLKEAALRSPSSRGIQPWRFFFITDRKRLSELSRAKASGSSFLRGARLGVVVCADQNQSDVWIEDCSIASIILQLAGQSMGLGSCWIQIRNRVHSDEMSAEEFVRDLMGLPENIRVESMIAFGYPDEEKSPVPEDELDYSKILQ
jgi:nitroreductase